MASVNKFQDFVEQFGKGVHQLHAAGHTLTVVFREIVDSFTYDYVVTKAPSATKLEFMSDLKAQVLKAREWRNRVATLTASIDVGQIESFINS